MTSSKQKNFGSTQTMEPCLYEKCQAAATAAEVRLKENPIVDGYMVMDELD